MSLGLIVVLMVLLCVLVAVLAFLGPKPLDLLGLNQDERREARLEAESEDMQQLLELTNRDRRLEGRPEVSEDELRYGPGV
jgi:hypothetical protein